MKILSTAVMLLSCLAGSIQAGPIFTGSMSIVNNDGLGPFQFTFAGLTQNGNPFSINLQGGVQGLLGNSLGNQDCHANFSPTSVNCTWTFTQPTLVIDTNSGAASSILWDGVTHTFGSGKKAIVSISIMTPAAQDLSTVNCSGASCFHDWAFGPASATVRIDLQILDLGNVIVSESLFSNAIYTGRASETIDHFNSIQYQLAPEPSTWAMTGGVLLWLGSRRRRLPPSIRSFFAKALQ